MFIDYITLMLVNRAAGLVLLATALVGAIIGYRAYGGQRSLATGYRR